MIKFPEKIDFLFSPVTVRKKCHEVFERCKNGKTHFTFHEDKIESTVDFVVDTIKENYPSLDIPFHSRWGHFKVGGIDRVELLDKHLESLDPLERARTKIDLVIISVLLDAGAGMTWSYKSKDTEYKRSEGLAVASFDWFMTKAFSKSGSLKVQGEKLLEIEEADLVKAFQVTPENPLVGVKGRVELLHGLGKVLESDEFKDSRPGNILDLLMEEFGTSFEAKDILRAVLFYFGEIWPSRAKIDGFSLGDTWHYPFENSDKKNLNNFVPFHKLSGWLTYSLIEPIQEGGVIVNSIEELTGLPEYRNGGLFLDLGLIQLRNDKDIEKSHSPDSEIIIEWRALTVCLLDMMGEKIQEKLGMSSEELPLCRVLEGGTWHAGRRIAKKLREDMGAPLNIKSDGTVF